MSLLNILGLAVDTGCQLDMPTLVRLAPPPDWPLIGPPRGPDGSSCTPSSARCCKLKGALTSSVLLDHLDGMISALEAAFQRVVGNFALNTDGSRAKQPCCSRRKTLPGAILLLQRAFNEDN